MFRLDHQFRLEEKKQKKTKKQERARTYMDTHTKLLADFFCLFLISFVFAFFFKIISSIRCEENNDLTITFIQPDIPGKSLTSLIEGREARKRRTPSADIVLVPWTCSISWTATELSAIRIELSGIIELVGTCSTGLESTC